MNIQDWFPLGLTNMISLQSKGLSRVFSNTTVQKHQPVYIWVYIQVKTFQNEHFKYLQFIVCHPDLNKIAKKSTARKQIMYLKKIGKDLKSYLTVETVWMTYKHTKKDAQSDQPL